MKTEPNPSVASEEEIKDVANKLGVDLEDSHIGTEEKESDSSKETDTETTESSHSSESGKPEETEEEVDYKVKYAASTKEFQEVYKPLQDNVRKLEQATGKKISDLIQESIKPEEEQIEAKGEETTELNDTSNDGGEVKEKLSSFEQRLGSMEEKVLEQEERHKLSAKEKVEIFQGKYEVSDDDYGRKYQPFLKGIKEMRKDNGDPYTLEEALEISYILGNKNNIDKIVETKVKILQKEQDLNFSPQGSKQTTSSDQPKFSDQQQEAARRLGVDLSKEEEKSS